jgi:aminopeptidase N
VEVAKALKSTHASRAREILIAARAHGHPKVRRAIASALGAFTSTGATLEALAELSSDASYFVIAEALASIGRSRAPGAFDFLVAHVDTASWQDTIAGGALRGLAELGDERAVPVLLACAAIDRAAWLREAALAAIPRLYATLDRRHGILVDTILRALDDPLHDIRRIAMTAAGRMEDPAARSRLARVADDTSEGFLQRIAADALSDIDRARRTPAEVDRLRRDVDELRSEVTQLRARIGKEL